MPGCFRVSYGGVQFTSLWIYRESHPWSKQKRRFQCSTLITRPLIQLLKFESRHLNLGTQSRTFCPKCLNPAANCGFKTLIFFFRSSKCAGIWLSNCCVCKFKNTALVRLLMQHLMPMLLWLVYALGKGCGNQSHMVFSQSCAQELHIKLQIQVNIA